MSQRVHPLCLVALVALGGCAQEYIAPFEECSARLDDKVEIPVDHDPALTTMLQTYHSTAGCTITFEVRKPSLSSHYLWHPVSGADYELRIEPEGPIGRLERGVLAADGLVTVDTVEGNTSVQLTIFPPGVAYKRTAIVFLD